MKKVLLLVAMAMFVATPVFANTRSAEIKDIRESFRAKIKTIRDERKRTLVEKLDSRFNEVNAKRTGEMARHLNKLTEVLGKVTGDTASASSAIQKAKDANTAQAAKTYTITITTEKNLKMDVGEVRSQLEADLKAVHELVVAARMAVKELIK